MESSVEKTPIRHFSEPVYDIDILIPFLNERENLPHLIRELETFVIENNSIHFNIIFIDDGSTDGSADYLLQHPSLHLSSSLIHLSRNFGSHAALRAGLTHSKSSYITFMYADLQDPLSIIPQMLKIASRGNDIIWANRIHSINTVQEKVFSRIYSALMRRFAISNYPEKGFDVVLFNHQVRELLNQNQESNSSIFLQLLTFGFSQSSINYEKQQRKFGKSKWTISKKIKLFIDSFVAFSFAPIKFVSIIGVGFATIGIIWMLVIILQAYTIGGMVMGWPSLICILLIGFGITNFSLGIIAEYLWRTLDATRKRPIYIIKSIHQLNNTLQPNL